ncbi:MAG: extensin family protein [Alphaproteobacteria bacterium]|nr:extensin family protein [Alphaproteobacteria bacterium]
MAKVFSRRGLKSLGIATATIMLLAVGGSQWGTNAAPSEVRSGNVPLPTLAPWHRRPTALGKGPARTPQRNGDPDAKATPQKAPPPPVDVWSPGDITGGLEACVTKLAAIQAKVEIAKPFRKGPCGAPAAIQVAKLGSRHALSLSPPATLRCKMAASLYRFVEESLQPAAIELLGSPVASFRGISSYSCRNRNGSKTGRLSEHALANALDVGTFKLKNGRIVSVLNDWGPTARDVAVAQGKQERPLVAVTGKETAPRLVRKAKLRSTRKRRGKVSIPPIPIKRSVAVKTSSRAPARTSERKSKVLPVPTRRPAKKRPTKRVAIAKKVSRTKEALFLKRVHKEACRYFGTVLGPEANEAHRDHFHFDMAPRKRSNYCR